MKKDNKSEYAILRQRVEELVKRNLSKSGSQLSEVEIQKLIHELWMHQIGLELQNEEFVLAKEFAASKKSEDEVNEFAENIINTIREPLLALDQDLRVVKASRSFYNFFKVTSDKTIGKLIYDLGDNQWDIPKLRELLETILPEKATFDDFEVEHDFFAIGKRVMLLNARQIKRVFGKEKIILLAIEDITERKLAEESLSEKNRMTSEYLDILLNLTHTPIIIWDSSLVIKRFNHEFEKLSGYKSTEVIDKKIDILFPEDKIESTLELLNNHLSDENMEVIEIDILTKNKDIRTVLWNSANIFDQEGINTVATIAQDITGRKRTEEALRISEEKYRGIFENIQDVYYEALIDGTILEVSPSIGILSKGGYHRNDLIGKSIFDFYSNTGSRNAVITLLLERGSVTDFEVILKNHDGSNMTCSISAKIQFDANGKPLKIIGSMRDITKRKHAEESLKKQKDDFETIFNLVPAQILYKDTHNNFIRVNHQACIDIGMTNEKIEGHSAEELFPSFAQQYFMDDLEVINAGKPKLGISEPFNTANGEKRWVHTDKVPVFGNDGKVNGIIAFVQDTTERKLAEEALRESESRLNFTLKSACMGVWHLDIIEDRRYFDDQVCSLLGINSATFTGTAEEFFGAVHPDDRQMIKAALARTIEKDVIYVPEYRVVWPDKSIHYIATRGRLSRDDMGAPVKINGILWDITEPRQKEEVLLKLKKAVDNSGEVIFLTDKEGIFTFVNRAFTSIYGFTADDIIGKVTPRILKNELLEASDYELFWETLLSGKEVRSELINKRKDGTLINIESTSTPIFDENKNIIGVLGIQRDITERKQTEKALQESEIKFRSITEQTTDLIAIADANGFIIYASPASETLFQYTQEEMCGHHFSEFIDETTVPEAVAGFNTILGSGERMKGERRMKRKDSSTFIGELNRSNYQSGELNGVLVIIHDITERKRADEELKQAHRELENLLNNLDKAVFSVDTIHNKMLQVSIAHETVFGYSQEEFFNNPQLWYEIIIPEDKPIVDAGYPVLFSGKNLHLEFRIVHGDGQIRWIEAKIIPTIDTNGKLIRIDGIASNITDRKRKEIELLEKEVQYRNLADSGLALIWTAGTDKLYNYFNEPWLKFTGRSLEQELGNGWAEGVHPDDFDSCIKTYTTAFDNREKFDMEYRLRHVSGEYRWINDLGTPNYNSNGKFIGYIGHCFDITDYKQTEQELIKAKEKAEESDRLKSAFLANMSHEVRTPLNSIIGFSELLADSDFEEEQKKEFIHSIITSGNTLLSIISDIMDISKMESGEITIRKKQINVMKFISTVKEEFAVQIDADKLELKLIRPDNNEETVILADADRLRQIFNNLMSNAIKFTPTGRIEIGYQPKGTMVEFYVRDTGIGIPAEYHDTIFERFRQVETEKTRKFGGNGLGLAIAKNLVELMGGKIWLESDPDPDSYRDYREGKGSVFYFTLPIYNSEI